MIDLVFRIANWLHEHYRVAGLLYIVFAILGLARMRALYPNDESLDCGALMLLIPWGIMIMCSKENPFR